MIGRLRKRIHRFAFGRESCHSCGGEGSAHRGLRGRDGSGDAIAVLERRDVAGQPRVVRAVFDQRCQRPLVRIKTTRPVRAIDVVPPALAMAVCSVMPGS